jgi:hypothetical protein
MDVGSRAVAATGARALGVFAWAWTARWVAGSLRSLIEWGWNVEQWYSLWYNGLNVLPAWCSVYAALALARSVRDPRVAAPAGLAAALAGAFGAPMTVSVVDDVVAHVLRLTTPHPALDAALYAFVEAPYRLQPAGGLLLVVAFLVAARVARADVPRWVSPACGVAASISLLGRLAPAGRWLSPLADEAADAGDTLLHAIVFVAAMRAGRRCDTDLVGAATAGARLAGAAWLAVVVGTARGLVTWSWDVGVPLRSSRWAWLPREGLVYFAAYLLFASAALRLRPVLGKRWGRVCAGAAITFAVLLVAKWRLLDRDLLLEALRSAGWLRLYGPIVELWGFVMPALEAGVWLPLLWALGTVARARDRLWARRVLLLAMVPVAAYFSYWVLLFAGVELPTSRAFFLGLLALYYGPPLLGVHLLLRRKDVTPTPDPDDPPDVGFGGLDE